jgi:hypothetical protein
VEPHRNGHRDGVYTIGCNRRLPSAKETDEKFSNATVSIRAMKTQIKKRF